MESHESRELEGRQTGHRVEEKEKGGRERGDGTTVEMIQMEDKNKMVKQKTEETESCV